MRVNRLRLHQSDAPPHHFAFQYEDALRTEIEDHGRLILIRQLRVASSSTRLGAGPCVARAWQNVSNSLCHGANPSAIGSNAVWFHDSEEAALLLLERRLRGLDTSAWFWRLAVPDAISRPVADWVGPVLRQYLANRSTGSAERILTVSALHAGGSERAAIIEQLLQFAAPQSDDGQTRPYSSQQSANPRFTTTGVTAQNEIQENIAESELLSQAATLTQCFPKSVRDVMQRLLRGDATTAFIAEVFTIWATRQVPSLTTIPARREMLVTMMMAVLRGDAKLFSVAKPAPPPTTAQEPVAQALHNKAHAKPEPPSVYNDPNDDVVDNESQKNPAAPKAATYLAAPVPLSEVYHGSTQAAEISTSAAGLYLTLLPLWHLDWPGYLARNPMWIEHHPTAQLLGFIAKHHKHGQDPIAQYWIDQSAQQILHVPNDLLALWRIALDRWLRRRTGMNLARLIARRGWVHIHNETVAVRFPADAVEISLRRLALDRDPGWLDWLGQSVRYFYSDRPVNFQPNFGGAAT